MSEGTDENDKNNNSSRLRKRRDNRKQEFSYSSNEEDGNIPNPPNFTLTEDQESLADTVSFTSTELMPPPPVPAPYELTNNHEIQLGVPEEEPANRNFEIIATYEDSVDCGTDTANSETLGKILKQVTENRVLLERILNYLPQQNLPQSSIQYKNIDHSSVPTEQFKKFKELLKFDKKLMENSFMQEQLQSFFRLSGGNNGKENVLRGLKKILSDKLARKCSLLGRKGNFAIGQMLWLKTLKDAAIRGYQTTDKEFEGVVSSWLRQANLRYIRKKHQAEMK
ncbi:uncharacterized protein LOC123321073 [Coccinella septempunctata]|uniref:uncharacterized protein LOC123321073 n=1 Tax=Coccinella septempunctata TaxID=41139 RepID=UPI001D076434|nr:uncharacterized protein LOC123321073 [Coccinella septempunctata]